MTTAVEQLVDLEKIGKEIAKSLGPIWNIAKFRTDEYQDRDSVTLENKGIRSANGLRITLQRVWNAKDRLRIWGHYPRDSKGQMVTHSSDAQPEITVAINRPPGKIAQAITSRFLPEYEQLVAKCEARAEQTNAYYAHKERRLMEFSKIFGNNKAPDQFGEKLHFFAGAKSTSHLSGDITPCSDSATINVHSVPYDLAIKIAEMLAAHIEASRTK